jgi:hypothetical protein
MESIQELNLVELGDKFGPDLVNRLEKDIQYSIKQKENFKIEIVAESTLFAEVAFVARAYAYIYEVSKKRKEIVDENRIGFDVCDKVNQLIKSL